MTQGKIERWHQTLKNRILLENYYLPGDLEAQIEAFVADYNHCRYHESIDNLTPANVYFGRGPIILAERERIKRQTIADRRLQHLVTAQRVRGEDPYAGTYEGTHRRFNRPRDVVQLRIDEEVRVRPLERA